MPSWTVNVPVMIECVWKNHIGETGHVWTLLHLPRIHFQEWCDAYKRMYCCQRYQLWVLWVWAGLINQFIFIHASTSHDQCGWFILNSERKHILTHLNGSQFRQVYSINHIASNHSQIQHENTPWMSMHQWRVISEKAWLVITHCEWEYSSTPMMELYWTHYHPFEWKSIQVSLFIHSHHNQSLSNTARVQLWNTLEPNLSALRERMSICHWEMI